MDNPENMTDEQLRAWFAAKKQAVREADMEAARTREQNAPMNDAQMAVVRNLLPEDSDPLLRLLNSGPNSDGEKSRMPRYVRRLERPDLISCPLCEESLPYELLDEDTAPSPNRYATYRRASCACERKAEAEHDARIMDEREKQREEERQRRIWENKRVSGIEGIQKQQTFAAFDRSRSPLMAQAATTLEAWANGFTKGETSRGYTLASQDYGCGKSHLMAATAIVLLNAGASVLVTSMVDLLAEMRKDFDRRQAGSTLARACSVDVLALDDLGAERIAEGERGDWVREQIFTIFDKRAKFARPVLVTTNLTPTGIEERIGGDHGGRIVSRLMQLAEWLSVGGPDGRIGQ